MAIPVISPFLASNSSNSKSSATYKSPPTYKSLIVVTIPVKVERPETLKSFVDTRLPNFPSLHL